MSVVDKLRSVIGSDSSPNDRKRFECHGCEGEFESFKTERRATCPECLSNEVEVVETLQR